MTRKRRRLRSAKRYRWQCRQRAIAVALNALDPRSGTNALDDYEEGIWRVQQQVTLYRKVGAKVVLVVPHET